MLRRSELREHSMSIVTIVWATKTCELHGVDIQEAYARNAFTI